MHGFFFSVTTIVRHEVMSIAVIYPCDKSIIITKDILQQHLLNSRTSRKLILSK